MLGANEVFSEAKLPKVNKQGVAVVSKEDRLVAQEKENFKDLVKEAIESEKKPEQAEPVEPENKLQGNEETAEGKEEQSEVMLTLQQMQAQITLANANTVEAKANNGESVVKTGEAVVVQEIKVTEMPTATNVPKEALKTEGNSLLNNAGANVNADNANQPKNLIQTGNEVKPAIQMEQQQGKVTILEETTNHKNQSVATQNQSTQTPQNQSNVAGNEQAKAQTAKQTQQDSGKQVTTNTVAEKTAETVKTVVQTETKSNNDVKQEAPKDSSAKAKPESEETKLNELPTMTKAEKLDAAKVNIKVAEPYTANTENKMFAKQVAEKIVFTANEGAREIEIQLMPKDLGKVTIKLIFEGNNALIQMTATNAKAQNILNLHAEGIKQIVESNTNTNVVVSVNDENKLNQQRDQFDGRGERQAKEEEPKKNDEMLDEDSQITFVNQLRLGLLSKNVS